MSRQTSRSTRLLRNQAQEFLQRPKNHLKLREILDHLLSGNDTIPSLLALEMVFTQLLKRKSMCLRVIPMKPISSVPECKNQLKLLVIYTGFFEHVLKCMHHGDAKIREQALSTAMNILAQEGKYPVEPLDGHSSYVPKTKLNSILMELLSSGQDTLHLIIKFTEYLTYDDILFFTWKLLPNLTAKFNPNEYYILNYLSLLEKMQVQSNEEHRYLCQRTNDYTFDYVEHTVIKIVNKIWHCIMNWEHSRESQQKLMFILIEKILPHLEKPLLITDFLMDSLDVGGPFSLLALQGLFTLMQSHNLNYPNIYTKLYSMFEPEIFHTKYKARLFYLSDLFLSSTHLPENLVAAFAKRLARLALLVPSEDAIIICKFIQNLILRHQGLKCLLNNSVESANADPYLMEESDPLKSNAINSSLWEIQTLQQHCQPTVASCANFINSPLPSVEWDISSLLDKTSDDIFDKEIQKHNNYIAMQFFNPSGTEIIENEQSNTFWNF